MRRFSAFTDKELDVMEEAFCIEGLLLLYEEIRKEKRYRAEKNNIEYTSNIPPHMEPDNCGNYVVMTPSVDNI